MSALLARIVSETGIEVRGEDDRYRLAGTLNRYRPDGAGLDRLLNAHGVEGEVLTRLRRLYEATASNWQPSHWYFVVRNHPAVQPDEAVALAANHVEAVRQLLAEQAGAEHLTFISEAPPTYGHPPDDGHHDTEVAIHEALTDWLTEAAGHELFVLEEAIYSMANDYWLTTYVLWPVLSSQFRTPLADPYFALWRLGLKVRFSAQGESFVVPAL